MKKIIMLVAVIFTAIVLTSCFGESDSLEWKTLPQSVYEQNDDFDQADIDAFKASVSIVVNGVERTLADALNLFPNDMTFTGFDLKTTGSKTITIKFKTLSIYWAYQVIDGEIPSGHVEAEYDWYVGKSSPYTINSIEDLYGFANIVNGKDGQTQYDFAGETVRLGADIDLSGKIWEPIGAAPRKEVHEFTYKGTVADVPTDVNSLYFLGGKLQNNALGDEVEDKVVRFGDAKTDPLISDEANFVQQFNAAKNANLLDEKEGFYFIDSYVYVSFRNEGTRFDDFTFYVAIDTPIGTYFAGTFDGQGRKIIGLSDVGYTPNVVYIYANSAMMVKGYTFGLFGVVKNDVTIKNLIFENVEVVGAYYDDKDSTVLLAEIDSVGAAVGYAFGDGDVTIDNVKVLSGFITGSQCVGGIAGRLYNTGNITIQNCENYATITLPGKGTHTGGIVGYISKTQLRAQFINNTNYGNVTSDTASQSGAMVHYANKGVDFINCRNFGNITGTASTGAQFGMVGNTGYSPAFTNCVNYGTLTNIVGNK